MTVASQESPFVVMRLPVQCQCVRRRADVKDIVAIRGRRVALVGAGYRPPLFLSGARVDEIPFAQKTDLSAIDELDRLRKLFERVRVGCRAECNALDHARDTQVVVPVNGVGDTLQVISQFRFGSPPKTEARNRQRDTRENRNDTRDGHELRDRKAAFLILPMLRNDCSVALSPKTGVLQEMSYKK